MVVAAFHEAVAACRYGLCAPWQPNGQRVEAFADLAALTERLEIIRRGRNLTYSTGRLEWSGDPPNVPPVRRATVNVGVLMADGTVALDLRLLVQGESLVQVAEAIERASLTASPGRGFRPAARA
jgi:hypothetical protein